MNRKMAFKSQRFAVILTVFLGFLMMMAPSMGHSRESYGEGNIRQVEKTVNIREARTIISRVVGQFYPGENFKVGFLDKKWYAVFRPDQPANDESEAIGYVYAPLMKPLPPGAGDVAVMFAEKAINIRKSRSVESDKTGRLYAGTKVKAAFLKGDWVAVFNVEETNIEEASALGYVYAPLLAPAEPGTPLKEESEPESEVVPAAEEESAAEAEEAQESPAPVAEEVSEEDPGELKTEVIGADEEDEAVYEEEKPEPLENLEWANIRYASRSVNIRKERSESSEIAGVLSPGEKVRVGFLEGHWHAVFKENDPADNEASALGYVYAPLLVPVALHLEALKRGEIKYTNKKVNIRIEPSLESDIVGVLLPETKIKAGLLQDDWYAVFDLNETSLEAENAFGYVYAPFLKPVAAPYNKTVEEPPLKFGDECMPQDCPALPERVPGRFLMSDPTVAELKKWAAGASFDLGWLFTTYDTTKSIGDTTGNPMGLSAFLSYDNWTFGLSYHMDTTKVDFARRKNGRNSFFDSEQDMTKIDLTARYLLRRFSYDHFTPYIIGGMTFIDLDETRRGDVVIEKDAGTSYMITSIGVGAIMPVNDTLGLRGDIKGMLVSSADSETENTLTDSALGISTALAGYWNIRDGWNMELGFSYSYIKEKDGFKHPHYTTGSEVGCMKEVEYFIKLGYAYRF